MYAYHYGLQAWTWSDEPHSNTLDSLTAQNHYASVQCPRWTNEDVEEHNTMEYRKLGSTGLEVSRICLGCMTYGVPDRGSHPWTLDEAQSRPLIRQALDLGINFFDT